MSTHSQKQRDAKLLERVVEILERHLSPNAKVERNQRLVDKKKNRKREVDVLIRVGTLPREAIFIVEVQKRKRKVGSQEFDSWTRKMQCLNVSGLICVSEAGFTKSVLNEAKTCGTKVRLLHLERNELRWPNPLPHIEANFVSRDVHLVAFRPLVDASALSDAAKEGIPQPHDGQHELWCVDGVNGLFTPNALFKGLNIPVPQCNTDTFFKADGATITLDREKGLRVYLAVDGYKLPVEKLEFDVEFRDAHIPATVVSHSYHDVIEQDTLAFGLIISAKVGTTDFAIPLSVLPSAKTGGLAEVLIGSVVHDGANKKQRGNGERGQEMTATITYWERNDHNAPRIE